ncbi:MAG: hypothetical protein NT111_02215 [Patescibacteria group bacterium]|jgi:hypothetical protein|nr:hypothetical protein [Patescibacteria group bacterium]
MKQIQKFLSTVRNFNFIANKRSKLDSTSSYLASKRGGYMEPIPVGFKSRTSSDFFLQR